MTPNIYCTLFLSMIIAIDSFWIVHIHMIKWMNVWRTVRWIQSWKYLPMCLLLRILIFDKEFMNLVHWYDQELIYYIDLHLPILIKPEISQGTSDCHRILLIFNEQDIPQTLPYDCVLQQFVNHDRIIYKAYSFGDHVLLSSKAWFNRSL